ncbi:MAG: TlpA family protein disulfide reductase [Spirochaetia bacterium]
MNKIILIGTFLIFNIVFIAGCSGNGEAEDTQAAEPEIHESEISGESLTTLREALTSAGFAVFEEPLDSPDFTLETPGGDERTLESFRGHVVLLNFWASWCGPCNVEKPSMVKLYKQLEADGLTIVGVNVQENAATAKEFIKKHDIPYPVLLDRSGSVAGEYGVRGIPTTYIIDRSGKALGGVSGAREWDSETLVTLFQNLLSVKM